MMFRTPPKEERAAKADDPPGTPATALLSARSAFSTVTSSAGGTSSSDRSDLDQLSSPNSATSIPSAFNTFSSPPRSVKPRTARNLFPQTAETERPVIVWELEAEAGEEDAREHSSGEEAVVSAIPEGRKRAAGADVLSDPGCSGGAHPSNKVATSNLIRRPASDVAGPTSSTFQNTQQIFPQTPDEHRARITEIMNKREKKKKKKHSRHSDSTSSVFSGTSTDTYESIKEGGDNPYAGYLKAASYDDDKKLIAKKKKNSIESKNESSSTSRDEKDPSKVSRGRWGDVEIDKKYSRPADDKASNVNPRLNEVMEQESERKKKHSQRDGAGSIASGASSNTRTSSKASKYAVDKQFNTSHTPKSVSGENLDVAAASSPNERDVPQSADEHKARLKEIMHKREMKNKTFKSGDDTSSISGISSNISGISSSISGVSSKSPSKVSRGTWSDIQTEKKYSRAGDDKSSNVSGKSSHASGASSTTSSIFAATRAKLKGYLTSYSRKKKRNQKDKRSSQTSPNTRSEAETPLLSPARSNEAQTPTRSISSDGPVVMGKPDTLLSIGEMEPLDSFPEIIIRKMPKAPHSPLRHDGEDIRLGRPLHRSPLSQDENTAKVSNLPWWMDQDGDQIDGEQIKGHYSGPINELLQPHGRGELLMKGASCRTFYGTWKNGKLVTPLTDASNDHSTTNDDPEPVTEDENSNSSEEQRRGNTSPKATSTKYAINKNYTSKTRAVAALEKVSKKAHKPKPLVRYNLGDACRSPQDMIICSSRQEATESAGLLKKWDGAFIKRSCGVWTYAILIEKAPQPLNVLKKRLEYFYWATVWEVDPRDEVEDSMLFAIDGDGSTKIIPKHTWAKYVRRVEPNPVPNIPKTVQEILRTVSDELLSSQDMPKTCSDNSTVEPTGSVLTKGMLNKRETQETNTSRDETTALQSSIESYFEAEFGNSANPGDSGTLSGGGPITSLLRMRRAATEQLMHIVDSERGSIERSSPLVYENLTDSETERGSVERSNNVYESSKEG